MGMSLAGLSCWGIDRGGSGPLWVEPFPGQVVLGCVRALARHEPVNERSSVAPFQVLA